MSQFSQLQAFIAVVEQAGFSAAAERLGIAKSAVSRRVNELENRLGARLLNRTTRRVSLTDAGRELHRRATRILADLEEAEQTVARAQGELSGILRVAAPLSFGIRHLTPALEEFLPRHPGIELDLDLNDRQVDLVHEGFDMAVRIGQLEDSSLIARRLSPIRRVTCASPEYLRRHGAPLTPDGLARHPLLHYSNVPRQLGWIFHDSAGHAIRPRVTVRLQANNGEVLAEAAAAGLGIVISPSFIAGEFIERGALQRILPDYRLQDEGLFALYPSNRHLSRRVRALVDFLAQRFGDTPYWDRCLR